MSSMIIVKCQSFWRAARWEGCVIGGVELSVPSPASWEEGPGARGGAPSTMASDLVSGDPGTQPPQDPTEKVQGTSWRASVQNFRELACLGGHLTPQGALECTCPTEAGTHLPQQPGDGNSRALRGRFQEPGVAPADRWRQEGTQSPSRIPGGPGGLWQRAPLRCVDRRGRVQTVWNKPRGRGASGLQTLPRRPSLSPRPFPLPRRSPPGAPLSLKAKKSLRSFQRYCRCSLFILRLFLQSAESQIIT